MTDEKWPYEEIRALVKLHGGGKGCAKAVGADPSNLSKWLKAIETNPLGPFARGNLNHEMQTQLLDHIGLGGMSPDPTSVHVWHVRAWDTKSLEIAYRFFFPRGAEMQVAPWSTTKLTRVGKLFKGPLQPEVHALSDSRLRVLVRTYPNFVLRKKADKFAFDGISSEYTVLKVKLQAPWTKGTPTIEQFDAAWGDKDRVNFEDVERKAVAMGLTAKDVLKLLEKLGKKLS